MSFREIPLKTEYRTPQDDVVKDFYIPVLKQSILYQRAVGFFSSTALSCLAEGILTLIENSGRIQLITSPHLNREDLEAIRDGLNRRGTISAEDLLETPIGNFEKSRLKFLSYLIASECLEIKIALPKDRTSAGMFHEKLGLMYDAAGNVIAFSGSMNESFVAFFKNFEAIDLFTSWTLDKDRAEAKSRAFDAMWWNFALGIDVLNFSETPEEYFNLRETAESVPFNEISTPQYKSVMPTGIQLREYQQEAVENWRAKNYRGIFDMATGTGKTYTALAAICRLRAEKNNLAVLIVCPYQHLVKQWRADIEKFGMKPIICYSTSPQRNWRTVLENAVDNFNFGAEKHFCMVATNATFSTKSVQSLVEKLSGNVVLVIDEAHNFGAKNLGNALPENIPYRLALSATLDRHGDPEGTQKLYDYFGEKCIEYTLKQAIADDMLTPYRYYPVVVSLNDDELAEYLRLTREIRRAVQFDKQGNVKFTKAAKLLLIQRARVVAGAAEKISVLRRLMADYKNDSYILVYCGATTMHDADYREDKPPIEEIRQIDAVIDLLGNELNMRVAKFTSEETAERREQLKELFEEGKHLQALAAIRCLDEGIDIPGIRTAFILASSTNPKEYIQRRGRVLRKFPGKYCAEIFDFITLPVALDKVYCYDPAVIESAKSLARRELARLEDFSELALNSFESYSLAIQIQSVYNLDINNDDVEDTDCKHPHDGGDFQP